MLQVYALAAQDIFFFSGKDRTRRLTLMCTNQWLWTADGGEVSRDEVLYVDLLLSCWFSKGGVEGKMAYSLLAAT